MIRFKDLEKFYQVGPERQYVLRRIVKNSPSRIFFKTSATSKKHLKLIDRVWIQSVRRSVSGMLFFK